MLKQSPNLYIQGGRPGAFAGGSGDFPKTQAWVNILMKIPPGEVTLDRLKFLGEHAKEPT